MKLSSVILFTLIGNALTQVQEAPKQELNTIAKCILEKNCGNDLTCQQSCLSANKDVYENILKVQKCLGSCDSSLPIDQYQKCTSLCNSNSGQAPSFPVKDQGSSKDDKDSTKSEKSDSSPTTSSSSDSSSKPTSGSTSSSTDSSAASNSTKSSNSTNSQSNSTSSKTSGSSSISKLSTSVIGLFMVAIFSSML